MVQVLPAVPSFGEKLADTLAQAGGNVAAGLAKRHAMSQFQALFNPPNVTAQIPNAQQPPQSTVQRISSGQGSLGDVIALQNAAEAAMPGTGNIVGQWALQQQKESQTAITKKETAREKMNVPKYEELATSIQNKEVDQTRFARLSELNNTGKIANPYLAKIVMKDGQLKMPAFFSPETQEFTKIVTDFTSQAKDSYGARITNFDLQTFLQKLPSLINSPEGRTQVIRNLTTMSRMTMLRDLGIKEAFDEAGGTGKISYDEAVRRGEKKYGDEIKELKKEYINPTKIGENQSFILDGKTYNIPKARAKEFVQENPGAKKQ